MSMNKCARKLYSESTEAERLWKDFENLSDLTAEVYRQWTKVSLAYWFSTKGRALYLPQHG